VVAAAALSPSPILLGRQLEALVKPSYSAGFPFSSSGEMGGLSRASGVIPSGGTMSGHEFSDKIKTQNRIMEESRPDTGFPSFFGYFWLLSAVGGSGVGGSGVSSLGEARDIDSRLMRLSSFRNFDERKELRRVVAILLPVFQLFLMDWL
jgi:hypothetical protein